MNIKMLCLAIGMILLLWGCGEKPVPATYGTLDKTPYDTKECRQELFHGTELKGILIDKIVVLKKKRRMHAYAKKKLIVSCRISLGKNADKGHKIQAGDYKTPIGHYYIVGKKCDNRLFRSLRISYPDREDRERARRLGVKSGGYITIHGQPKWNASGIGDGYTFSHDWTEGCIAVSNKIMRKLWEAVRRGIKVDIYP